MMVSPKLERAAPVLARVAAARVLRPGRAGLYDALDVAEAIAPRCATCGGSGAQQERQTCLTCDGRGYALDDAASAAELWEALASRGVIPLGWVGDARRWFALPCVFCADLKTLAPLDPRPPEPLACPRCAAVSSPNPAHPPTVAACVALASDVAGVLAAEAIAREFDRAQLVRPDLVSTPDRTVWRVVAADVIDPLRERMQRWAAGGFGFSAVACDALRDLLATGYALDAVTDTAVVLACPAIDQGGA